MYSIMNIGTNILICLGEKDMSVLEYAKLIGVARTTAENYISGYSVLDVNKLLITAQYFKKTMDWFLEDEHFSKISYSDKEIEYIMSENTRLNELIKIMKYELDKLENPLKDTTK